MRMKIKPVGEAGPLVGQVTKKPWGREQILAVNGQYVVKHLFVKASRRLSLQYHERKRETMVVIAGTGTVEYDGKAMTYEVGTVIDIPVGVRHRVWALSNTEIIETSTPHLDDVVRIEDDYGRGGEK